MASTYTPLKFPPPDADLVEEISNALECLPSRAVRHHPNTYCWGGRLLTDWQFTDFLMANYQRFNDRGHHLFYWDDDEDVHYVSLVHTTSISDLIRLVGMSGQTTRKDGYPTTEELIEWFEDFEKDHGPLRIDTASSYVLHLRFDPKGLSGSALRKRVNKIKGTWGKGAAKPLPARSPAKSSFLSIISPQTLGTSPIY